MSEVFLSFYDISSFFFIYCSALRTSLARVQGLSLMVATHNSTSLKENAITEDISFISHWPKKILYQVTRYKKALQITRAVFFMFFLGNIWPVPCILPSSTSLDLTTSYMSLFHLLQMLLCRSSLGLHISHFQYCEQPFFQSVSCPSCC